MAYFLFLISSKLSISSFCLSILLFYKIQNKSIDKQNDDMDNLEDIKNRKYAINIDELLLLLKFKY
jgi:hypothetical protein